MLVNTHESRYGMKCKERRRGRGKKRKKSKETCTLYRDI